MRHRLCNNSLELSFICVPYVRKYPVVVVNYKNWPTTLRGRAEAPSSLIRCSTGAGIPVPKLPSYSRLRRNKDGTSLECPFKINPTRHMLLLGMSVLPFACSVRLFVPTPDPAIWNNDAREAEPSVTDRSDTSEVKTTFHRPTIGNKALHWAAKPVFTAATRIVGVGGVLLASSEGYLTVSSSFPKPISQFPPPRNSYRVIADLPIT